MNLNLNFWCLMPLSAIFQLYHGDQFQWWKKAEYPERTTDNGQATGKLYHLRLRVECTLFCNLQSRVRTHAVLVIGLHELIGNPTTYLTEPTGSLSSQTFCTFWTDLILKLYVFIPLLYILFPLQSQKGNQSSKSNGKDNKSEYQFS